MKIYKKIISNPVQIIPFLHYFLKTLVFKLNCILTRKNVTWGKNLRIQGKLSIKGNGNVYIGDNVTIGMTVTPWTYDKDAVIRISDNVFLNGTKFACKESISIGKNCMIGECRIFDTNFHSININRHDPSAYVKVEKIDISQNVWIAPDSVILPGVNICENSVVAICSVVTKNVPKNTLVAGNPAKIVKYLEH